MSAVDVPAKPAEFRPPTLVEAVLQQLREDLIRARYAPGDPVRVDRVAAELGISALPVREALRVLLAEGRVQYAPHRGYRVTELTLEQVEEIYLMCGLLETESIRRGVEALDDAGIERMRSLLETLLSPPRRASVWHIVTVHQEFHFVPIEYARLPLIEAELRRLWDHTDHYRSLYLFGDPQTKERINAEHAAFVDACAEHDAGLAVALAEEHRRHALARFASQEQR